MWNLRKYRKAFSVMEVIIVVTVLASVAGIVVPVYMEGKNAAMYAKAKGDLEGIASAAKSYYSDHYTMAGLTLATLNQQGYLSVVGKDPWGNDYVLHSGYVDADGDEKPDIGSVVVVYSKGPNGTQNTDHATGNATGTGPDDVAILIIKVE